MKKVLLLGVLFTFLALPVLSVVGTAVTGPPETIEPEKALVKITDWLFTILLILAALMIVVAAYYFITAAGDPEDVKKARNFVLYALIGVAVAFLSRGLVALVLRMMV